MDIALFVAAFGFLGMGWDGGYTPWDLLEGKRWKARHF